MPGDPRVARWEHGWLVSDQGRPLGCAYSPFQSKKGEAAWDYAPIEYFPCLPEARAYIEAEAKRRGWVVKP